MNVCGARLSASVVPGVSPVIGVLEITIVRLVRISTVVISEDLGAFWSVTWSSLT